MEDVVHDMGAIMVFPAVTTTTVGIMLKINVSQSSPQSQLANVPAHHNKMVLPSTKTTIW